MTKTVLITGSSKGLGRSLALIFAKKAYRHINLKEDLRTPDFFEYEELLKKFRNLL